MPWIWLRAAVLLAAHDEQIAEHGGPAGIRDAGLFESALARPLHLDSYGASDAAALAAAYAFGIVRNHPFVDGNKRTGFVALELFLALNGYELTAGDHDVVRVILDLASGNLDENDLAAWVRGHLKKQDNSGP